MIRILDITQKDLIQLMRDRKTFMFLLIMPIAFTLLFGYAFGGFSGGASDSRLPVGWLDQDGSRISKKLHDLLSNSQVLRLDDSSAPNVSDWEQLVATNKIAAAIIVPPGYGRAMLEAKPMKLVLIGDPGSTAGLSIQTETVALANRLDSAVQTAVVMDDEIGDRAPFDYALDQALTDWENPPIAVSETTSSIVPKNQANSRMASLAQSSPGMMLQFGIAGLLTAAQVIVNERKSRALQRLLTTATRRAHILIGHYLAIFVLIFAQFVILILFGQFILKIDYLRVPLATFTVAACAALCIAGLGLLIGVMAKSEDQAVIFSLVPMFLMAGLGGAWVPLEVTGEAFQAIGHLSPVAWGMDGFKNISIRGLGFESVLIPSLALIGYAVLFFTIATLRFRTSEERS